MDICDFIRRELDKSIDLKYLKFYSSLIPNINNIKGVRVPNLRKIAKTISKREDVNYYLNYPILDSYEELTIYGLVIGYLKLDLDDYLKYLKFYIPLIDNWSTCDVVVSNLKFTKNNLDQMYPFFLEYLYSNKEFECRFAVVIFLTYYLTDNYVDNILVEVSQIKHEGYYSKMAIAWLISVCYIKYKDKVLNYFEKKTLDSWIYNKAIQKIIESNQISLEEKNIIRKLKK